MPDTQTIWLFCLAATALIVIPGPAVLYIVAQSVGQGRRAGLISASGVASLLPSVMRYGRLRACWTRCRHPPRNCGGDWKRSR